MQVAGPTGMGHGIHNFTFMQREALSRAMGRWSKEVHAVDIGVVFLRQAQVELQVLPDCWTLAVALATCPLLTSGMAVVFVV